MNGDPTRSISKIHWSSWGGGRAVGRGTAGFVWAGFAVADGTRYVGTTVAAFDLGTCDGALPTSVKSGISLGTVRRSIRRPLGGTSA